MAKIARRGASYDDLLALPEEFIAELIDGNLYASRHLRPLHSRAAARLLTTLDAAFDEGMSAPDGWWIMWAPEVHLGPDVLVPNLLGLRRSVVAAIPDVPYLSVVPQWVAEVPDLGTVRFDRLMKMPRYLAAGVEYVWILDVRNRALEVWRRIGERYELTQMFDDEQPIVRAEPFDAIEFPLESLWLPTAPDPRN
jgi:Uma2 family endonuclease